MQVSPASRRERQERSPSTAYLPSSLSRFRKGIVVLWMSAAKWANHSQIFWYLSARPRLLMCLPTKHAIGAKNSLVPCLKFSARSKGLLRQVSGDRDHPQRPASGGCPSVRFVVCSVISTSRTASNNRPFLVDATSSPRSALRKKGMKSMSILPLVHTALNRHPRR